MGKTGRRGVGGEGLFRDNELKHMGEVLVSELWEVPVSNYQLRKFKGGKFFEVNEGM